MKLILQSLAVILLLFPSTYAQKLAFRAFSFEQGLNTYNIQKVIQDRHGFIWIGTQEGLYRYNGQTFSVFKKLTGKYSSLRENFVFDLCEDSAGHMLIAEFNGGIDQLDTRSLAVTPFISEKKATADGLDNLWLKRVYHDNHANTWVGGKDFLTIYNSRRQAYLHVREIEGFTGPVDVIFIKPVNKQLIAVGVNNYGILLFDSRSQECVNHLTNSTVTGSANAQVKDMIVSHDTAYIATSESIIAGRITERHWMPVKHIPCPLFRNTVINCMVAQNNQICWIGTNTGLIRVNLRTNESLLIAGEKNRKRWLQDNTINNLFIDNQNNLWISGSKLLYVLNLNSNLFRYFSGDESGSDKMDHIYSLVQKSKQEIFATGTDGLYITNLVSGQTNRVPGSEVLGIVHFIVRIEPGVWFMSTDKGMYAYLEETQTMSQEYIIAHYPEWAPYIQHYFNQAVSVQHTMYWASEEQEGLFKWDQENHRITQLKAAPGKGSLPENHIHNIKTDRNGNLWLLSDQTLSCFDTGTDQITKVLPYQRGKPGPNSGIFFDLFDDGETLWFSTYGGGLNGYNRKNETWTYITEKEGLCNNSVYCILPENDSILWVSSNMGLSRVNFRQKKCTNYYYEDGLQSNAFDEKGSLSIGNKLYFGGIDGFTEVSPLYAMQKASYFPAYIYQVEYYQKGQKHTLHELNWQKVYLPPEASPVVIRLCALSFSNSRKLRFSYRIKDLQDDYVEVGNDNTITFHAPEFGAYSIEIRYIDESGNLVYDQLSLDLYIEPYWYQTALFKILIGCAIVGLGYFFYYQRADYLKKQRKLKEKISNDLHDDIGSTLNSIKIFANLAFLKNETGYYTEELKKGIQSAIVSVRDMVWVLDDKRDSLQHLVDRIEQFILPIAAASQIRFEKTFDFSLSEMALQKEEKRNLYLIIKEAFNNSLKYAEATVLHLEVTRLSANKLKILISDNGKGFDQQTIVKGNGLDNIKYRAEQINYRLSISSVVNGGTSIELTGG